MKVCIDPGHGMDNRTIGVFDPGATHVENGALHREADVALRYGLALKDALRMTRCTIPNWHYSGMNARTHADPPTSRGTLPRTSQPGLDPIMTKLFPFALAVLALAAGGAAAENAFTFDGAQSTASSVALTNVQADQASTVRVYADGGPNGFGQLLGSARIDAGVTGDLAIDLREPAFGNLTIVMMGPDVWAAQLTTASLSTNADSSAFASAPLSHESGLARAPSSAVTGCVVTSSDGQLVHDRRGNVVTC